MDLNDIFRTHEEFLGDNGVRKADVDTLKPVTGTPLIGDFVTNDENTKFGVYRGVARGDKVQVNWIHENDLADFRRRLGRG